MLFLFLLPLLAHVSQSRTNNYRVSGYEKEGILNSRSAAEAYEKYNALYGDRDGPLLLMTVDPNTKRRSDKQRKINFVHTFRRIKEHNRLYETGQSLYRMTVNQFTAMSQEEKSWYLGVKNATKPTTRKRKLLKGDRDLPSSLNWNSRGYVTGAFDQGKHCGSCWTFPAVALVEFAVKNVTGQLIQLSNQQLLDCTYEVFYSHVGRGHDGCDGGLYEHAWDLVIETQHLASLAKYRYWGYDRHCEYDRYSNALLDTVELTGYKFTASDADSVMEALQIMPLAVSIKAEEDLKSYDKGMYDGCQVEYGDPDHAVLLTGYGPGYWEMRNSWGQDWGLNGFFRFNRNKKNTRLCLLLDYAAYITFRGLGDGISTMETVTSSGETTIWTTTTEEKVTSTTEGQVTTAGELTTTENLVTTVEELTTTKNFQTTVTTFSKSGSMSSVTQQPTQDFPTSSVTMALTTPYMETCDPGYHWDGISCEMCGEGEYSGYGSSCCSSCPEGTTSPAGSTSIDDCVETVCDDAALVRRKCKKWAGKGFCSDPEHISFMETECRKSCGYCSVYCDAGYGLNDKGRCEVCPVNTYSEYRNQACTACPEGTVSEQGSTDVSACVGDTCHNTQENTWCEANARLGRCHKKSVKKQCARSCEYCEGSDEDDGNCVNVISDTTCDFWRSAGFCYDTQTENIMTMLCGRTCGTCRSGHHDDCYDSDEYAGECPTWAQSGHCTAPRFAVFMLKNCAASCGKCEAVSPITTPPSPTHPDQHCWLSDVVMPLTDVIAHEVLVSPEDCIEQCRASDRCQGVMVSPVAWVSWKSRECFLMGSDMVTTMFGWTAASKSCFEQSAPTPTPTPTSPECLDSAEYGQDCPRWAQHYCNLDKYSDFMAKNCRKSCGFCTDHRYCGNSVEYTESCRVWAASGYCTEVRFLDFMSRHCQKACGHCQDWDCFDKNAMCAQWQMLGYCYQSEFVTYMKSNCPAVCGYC